jgi:hypothetical protein
MAANEVFWGKRVNQHAWQFPQGGIKHGETPERAMYRELEEEIGLTADHVRILGRTRDWLRYEVPERWVRRDWRGTYRGQKQIWYLLRMVGRDCDVKLRAERATRVRCLALARLLGAARGGDRLQARGLPAGARRIASLSRKRPAAHARDAIRDALNRCRGTDRSAQLPEL